MGRGQADAVEPVRVFVFSGSEFAKPLTKYVLREQPSWQIDLGADGALGIGQACGAPYDLIVVGAGKSLPPAADVVAMLRGCGSSAVVVVWGGPHDRPSDLEDAISAGADDYLAGDDRPAQVLSRLKVALLRGPTRRVLERTPIKIELDQQRTTVLGEPVELTRHQSLILVRLLQRVGAVVSFEELESFAGIQGHPSHANLQVAMAGLRKRLGRFASLVQTVPGTGYSVSRSTPGGADGLGSSSALPGTAADRVDDASVVAPFGRPGLSIKKADRGEYAP